MASGSPPAAVKLNENGIPNFDALPLRPGDPKYSTWGLYGEKDELGTLNRLTDERVAEAAKNEIKAGVRYVPELTERFACNLSYTLYTFHLPTLPVS